MNEHKNDAYLKHILGFDIELEDAESARLNALLERVHSEGLQELKEFAGAQVELMLRDQETTETYLNHSDPKLRIAALCLSANHWTPSDRAAQAAEFLMLTDSDEEVAGAAILCLKAYYTNTNNLRIFGLLREIVRNVKKSSKVRGSAYLALYHVAGELANCPAISTFRFPEDVDWSFLNSR